MTVPVRSRTNPGIDSTAVPERRAAGDDFRFGHRGAQCAQDVARLRGVMAERDGVAVVDVAHRDADHIGSKGARGFARGRHRIAGETKIQEQHLISGCLERRCHTRQAVWHDRIWLALAIGAHQQHPRSTFATALSHCAHRSIGQSLTSLETEGKLPARQSSRRPH
jgi:hypothetical protein